MSTPDPEAPKLDPKPWVSIDGVRHPATPGKCAHGYCELKPRPEYSQRREDYPNA